MPSSRRPKAFSRVSAKDYQKLLSEKDIQAQIVQVLKLNSIIHAVTDASRAFGKDGKPRRSKVTPDWPDITCIVNIPTMLIDGTPYSYKTNQCLLIETKCLDGKLSDGQARLHSEIRKRHGTPILVPHSLEEFYLLWQQYVQVSLLRLDQQTALTGQSARKLLGG